MQKFTLCFYLTFQVFRLYSFKYTIFLVPWAKVILLHQNTVKSRTNEWKMLLLWHCKQNSEFKAYKDVLCTSRKSDLNSDMQEETSFQQQKYWPLAASSGWKLGPCPCRFCCRSCRYSCCYQSCHSCCQSCHGYHLSAETVGTERQGNDDHTLSLSVEYMWLNIWRFQPFK